MARILVINPNSSKAMTQLMAQCLTGIAANTAHQIACIELAKSPPGINTDENAKAVVPHIIEAVEQEKADAIVIGCFSDPGIQAVREQMSAPVFGIAQCAYLTALGLGGSVWYFVDGGHPRLGGICAICKSLNWNAGWRAIGQ